jgi:serine/threonine-protein kinase RsbW
MRTGAITLSIDSSLEHVFLVGLAVNKICRSIPVSEQLAYEAEVSVVEAVNNSIKHGYREQGGHRVEVEVAVEPGRVTFKVCDCGPPMERVCVSLPEVSGTDHHALAEGGRGVFIMHAFTDRVTYDRVGDRNVLTLVKQVPVGTSGPPKVARRPEGPRRNVGGGDGENDRKL